MRIIAGHHKGRLLLRPPGMITRPMMDRVRESGFNILAHQQWFAEKGNIFQQAMVLDAFAGSGAIALELLSRGAKFAFVFDKSPRALATIRENVWTLKEHERVKLLKADATNPPRAFQPMDIVFLDPPFGKGLVLKCLPPLINMGWITATTLIVAEVESTHSLDLPSSYKIIEHKIYGSVQVYFFTI